MKPLVLVIGGAGFIGSHVVERLLARGHPVRVYDKLVAQVHNGAGPRYVPPEAEFVRADLCDDTALRRALRGARLVVHVAAEVGIGQSMYEIVRYVDANARGTAVLLELLANERHQIEKLVVASSMTIYGEGAYACPVDGQVAPPPRSPAQLAQRQWELRCPACGGPLDPLPTAEDTAPRPGSVYAISKLAHEMMALAVGHAYHLPVTALRYFNCYGPRQSLSNPYAGIGALFSARLLNRQPPLLFEDGLQLRDFVHVRDVARATVLALDASAANGTAINVGSGQARSVHEIACALARHLRVDLEPRVTEEFRAGDVRHCYADITRARELLGFEPRVRFEDGMGELAAWAACHGAVDTADLARRELARRGLTG